MTGVNQGRPRNGAFLRFGAFFTGALLAVELIVFNGFRTEALTLNTSRDCDNNAIIRCGAVNFDELNNRYNQTGVAQAFNCFGISRQDVSSMRGNAVAGYVTKDGRVFINSKDKPVATDAITAGRQNMAGSTAISCGESTFYQRPPSVSFASSSLVAFVVMDSNDRFAYAVLASCGNPVKAVPVKPAVTKKKAAPQPIAKAAPKAPTQQQTQVQTQTVAVTYPPAPTPAPAPAAQPAPTPTPVPQPTKTLPSTGPGNVLTLGGAATVIGTIGHYLYQRRMTRL